MTRNQNLLNFSLIQVIPLWQTLRVFYLITVLISQMAPKFEIINIPLSPQISVIFLYPKDKQ